MELLEAFGIRVMEVSTDLPVWAFAARFGDEFVVAVNPSAPADRCRLSAAHELGHVLLGHCWEAPGSGEHRDIEHQAYEFASLLLMPRQVLKEVCAARLMLPLVEAKRRYGISVAAMVYAAEREGFYPERLTRRLWIEFQKRGWRENEPGAVRPDRAWRFERLLEEATSDGGLPWSSLADTLGVRESEIRARLQTAIGATEDSSVEGGDGGPDAGGPRLRLVR
jgi:Zn-dependent peptidase ImmA (M78 family)